MGLAVIAILVKQSSIILLSASDDRAALFTAIPDDISCGIFHRFKIVLLRAGAVETFGTIAVAQFLGGDCQMTAAAAQRALPLRQQFESRMFARSHQSASDSLFALGASDSSACQRS